MGLTDISVVGHLGVDELAACALANVWMNFTIPVVQQAGSVLSTVVSQAFGAGQYRLCGQWLQISCVFTVALCIPVSLSWALTAQVLMALGNGERVSNLAQTFSLISTTWLLPNGIYWTMRMYLQALGEVRLPMVVNLIFVVVNLLFNIVFVHGIPGVFVGLGFIGSPLATSLSRWLQPLLLLFLVRRRKSEQLQKTWQGWSCTSFTRLRLSRFTRLYTPMCLGNILETAALQIVTLLASRLGKVEAGTNSALMSLLVCVLAGSFGISYALGQRVGFHLGAARPCHAQTVAHAGMVLSGVYGLTVGSLVTVFRYQLGRIFSDSPEALDLVPRIAWLCGFGFLFLSQVTAIGGAMNGQGRPLPVMICGFLSIWGVSLPTAWALGFSANLRLPGLWYGLAIGYFVFCLVLAVIFRMSNWPRLVVEAQIRSEQRAASRS
eukprot:TRINITY_DN74118_c0_g1_i1.p1 TRINITY_DN74118_c0_g1~~TRINITY_DN74118_c0_g1_i1.p1  ORF type:complete len:493 (+),score=16.46 TRINITY_DN74118_c0_g1_i1:173-1480(+)